VDARQLHQAIKQGVVVQHVFPQALTQVRRIAFELA
jgi:hypothetical protein